ncbi:YrzQ family protein [Cytobacillus spongiae]|jgi:hypothetical protein|nr:YrzQ family protein [Cytobacillus spongiae]UII54980.1 YrzQ family protein [Cytobacillus spongiae]
MNKMMTSMMALGAGIAAYNMASRNNMMSKRKMKKLGRRINKALF